MRLGINEIEEICIADQGVVTEYAEWPSPGFLLKEDGIWVRNRSEYFGSQLTAEELRALTRHPTGDYSKPALTLPCSLDALIEFLIWDESLDCCEYFDESANRYVNPLLELKEYANNNQEKEKSKDSIEIAQKEKRIDTRINIIIRTLSDLGHNPLELPVNESGRKGVKAQVRAAVGTEGIWFSRNVFDDAWEEATRRKDIAYKK